MVLKISKQINLEVFDIQPIHFKVDENTKIKDYEKQRKIMDNENRKED
jgi:hypothetical protein